MSPVARIGLLFLGAAAFGGGIVAANLLTRRGGDHGFGSIQRPGRPPECAGQVRWSARDLPIELALDPSLSVPWQRAVMAAAAQANAELGRDVFIRKSFSLGDAEEQRRQVFVETTNTSTHGQTSTDVGVVSCRVKSGRVRLPGLAHGGETMRAAAMHELGHVLGLDHDLIESSIMWPTVAQWSRSSHFTDADVQRLQESWALDGGR